MKLASTLISNQYRSDLVDSQAFCIRFIGLTLLFQSFWILEI